MTTALPISKLFGYKAWANAEIVTAIQKLQDVAPEADYQRAVLILDHTYVVDRIFAGHLLGESHGYAGLVSMQKPSLEQLSELIRTSDRWYDDYVSHLDTNSYDEPLDFTFIDGAPGRMSRIEILMHVSMHGAYHRGAIGRLLAQHSLAPPKDIFTRFLHDSEPAGRRRDT